MPVSAPVLGPPGDAVARHAGTRSTFRRIVGKLVFTVLACVLLLGFGRPAAPAAVPTGPLEYRVKAGFLFNFARFVEWPAEALPPDRPFHLAIVAPPAVYQTILETLSEKKISGRELAVTLLDPANPGPGLPPHVIFVHHSVAVSTARLLALFPDQPVLIVGESPGFAAAGGMIGFVLRGDNLRFQVNLVAARRARLQLSSQLESLAEIVQPKS